MRNRQRALVAVSAAFALSVVGSTGGAFAQDTTLRMAMGSPGEAAIRVFDSVAAQFEELHPGVKVEMNYQDDDLYETIGLPNLLARAATRLTSTSSGPAPAWPSGMPMATRPT